MRILINILLSEHQKVSDLIGKNIIKTNNVNVSN